MKGTSFRDWVIPFIGFGVVVILSMLLLFVVYADVDLSTLFSGSTSGGGVTSMRDFQEAMQGQLK